MQANALLALTRDFDPVRSNVAGAEMGTARNRMQSDNALLRILREQGGEVMQGQMPALNALAATGPQGLGLARQIDDQMYGRVQNEIDASRPKLEQFGDGIYDTNTPTGQPVRVMDVPTRPDPYERYRNVGGVLYDFGEEGAGARPSAVQANEQQFTPDLSEPIVEDFVSSEGQIDPNFTGSYGLQGMAASVANTASDAVGGGTRFDGIDAAQRIMQRLNVQTQTLLAGEIGGRPSNYYLERVQTLLPEPGRLSMGPERATARMSEIADLLGNAITDAQAVLQNRGLHTASRVSNAANKLPGLIRLRDEYRDIATEMRKELKATSPRRSSSANRRRQGSEPETVTVPLAGSGKATVEFID